ncbi:LOW QUALITY PROTEIN: arf-GAP domain and FG repeat-containing protein 2 [Falco rusticolus]|uniref:LOW QUALITY PROTEIN: arf-GAP domain and FG repeat-containing protein 2 n=1 Tax=Falco rusticolus TaxID=120794 RepID=UPI0018865AC3|nr:LOW QUALITY PROTEIN: arf-GAP domain and FG repeat-containing protein 2 [Falco rusticolus]
MGPQRPEGDVGPSEQAGPPEGGVAARGSDPPMEPQRPEGAWPPGVLGAGGRRGSAARDAEAELWGRRVRELVSASPGNRRCCECGQRGVTYVDISVGSLVCTGCSGALRGLNPPHRVKSISMTTFTEAEVQFLQARGNEVCRRVWLGTFDAPTSGLPDSRDPQKLKEFLQDKYEKKRWYVAPEQAPPPPKHCGRAGAPPATPGGHGDTAAVPPSPQRPPQPSRKASTDLLADIGGDPFAAPQPPPAFATFPAFPGPAPPRAAFPNFDAFGAGPGAPSFGGAAPLFHAPPAPTGGLGSPHQLGGTGVGVWGPPTVMEPRRFIGEGVRLESPLVLVPGEGVWGAPITVGGPKGFWVVSPQLHLPLPPPGGAAAQGGATSVPPSGGGASASLFGTLRPPPALPPPPYGGYTNPFTGPAAPRPSTNPFQSNGAAFATPPVPGGFPSPFQADGSSFSGFNIAKASTNPFVTVPAPTAPFGIKHPTTNPFL